MSRNVESGDRQGLAPPESGFEALRRAPEFRGAVEPIDTEGHAHSNDHFALIYETDEELFTAAAPFVRQGLERGERCLFVVDERSEDTVLEELSSRGVDVDDARASGALQFSTVEETYLREEPFDPAGMISLYADVIDDALEEYEGLRVVAGTTWIDQVPIEAFLEYESRVNELLERSDAMALCHYDRSQLPTETVRDVIKTHPNLISEGTVCHNFYYTPPEELFGPDQPANEIDRILGTVRDRARAKRELAEHKRFLQRLTAIIADPDRSFEEKLQALFELGCERFDLALGGVNKVDPDGDWFEVEYISDDHELFEPGVELPLSETYCQAAAGMKEAAAIVDPPAEGFDDVLIYEEYGTESYLGTYVPVEGDVDRTLGFIASDPPSEPFSEEDRTFIELMGQWVKYELEHQQYQADLEETVEQLTQSNDRLKQFAYAASHDLQEPLRMVSTYLQLLEDRHAEDLDDEAVEYMEFALDGADRMRAMVDDLLAYSRVEQADDSFRPVDCETVIDRVTDDLRMQIEETGAEVSTGSLPTVLGSDEQLEQLFSNLVSNAVKYNESDPPRVEITAERDGDQWLFTVADNGIGIETEKTDRIFEVFKRLHHDDEYPGTGIGLALCQEIVENHGGTIWVDSEPGDGSTFSFTLPEAAEER